MALTQHPHRTSMQEEVHARPPLMIPAESAEVWQWVLVAGDTAWPEPISASRRHQVVDLDGGLLRVERHTEFVTLTYCGDTSPAPHIRTLIDACPGTLLTGARLIVTPDPAADNASSAVRSQVFVRGPGAPVIVIATDFRVREHGLIEYQLAGKFEDGMTRGRVVKLVLDLDTYRMAALLSLPQVRDFMPQLQRLERSAQSVTEELAQVRDLQLDSTIRSLSTILVEVSTLHETMRFRLAASRAYYDLVQARLSALAERPLGQQQTCADFIGLRLTPAMNTINAFERRLNELSTTVHSTMALARTRLDLVAQNQNQSLLRSMEKRARQQVHLSQAVEGLSTAAITYYAVGLLDYLLAVLPDSLIDRSLWLAGSVPVVAAVVWLVTRRISRKLIGDESEPAMADHTG